MSIQVRTEPQLQQVKEISSTAQIASDQKQPTSNKDTKPQKKKQNPLSAASKQRSESPKVQKLGLKDLFPDWNEEDLELVMLECNNEFEVAVARITEGQAKPFSQVTKNKKSQVAAAAERELKTQPRHRLPKNTAHSPRERIFPGEEEGQRNSKKNSNNSLFNQKLSSAAKPKEKTDSLKDRSTKELTKQAAKETAKEPAKEPTKETTLQQTAQLPTPHLQSTQHKTLAKENIPQPFLQKNTSKAVPVEKIEAAAEAERAAINWSKIVGISKKEDQQAIPDVSFLSIKEEPTAKLELPKAPIKAAVPPKATAPAVPPQAPQPHLPISLKASTVPPPPGGLVPQATGGMYEAFQQKQQPAIQVSEGFSTAYYQPPPRYLAMQVSACSTPSTLNPFPEYYLPSALPPLSAYGAGPSASAGPNPSSYAAGSGTGPHPHAHPHHQYAPGFYNPYFYTHNPYGPPPPHTNASGATQASSAGISVPSIQNGATALSASALKQQQQANANSWYHQTQQHSVPMFNPYRSNAANASAHQGIMHSASGQLYSPSSSASLSSSEQQQQYHPGYYSSVPLVNGGASNYHHHNQQHHHHYSAQQQMAGSSSASQQPSPRPTPAMERDLSGAGASVSHRPYWP